MNINELYEGQIIKNYKVLCADFLNVKPSAGNSRVYHFRELDRYCTYHKNGQKIIIDSVFEVPKEKINGRGNKYGIESNSWKDYKQLKISYEERDNIGIYYIIQGDNIYIGSTTWGFRNRFQQHYHGYDKLMKHTYDMLQNGGEFCILYDMTGIQDEPLIRQLENEYIQYFIKNTNYNVINKKENAWSKTERIRPLRNKTIKIREDKYEQAMQLLMKNGLLDLEEDNVTSNNYILDDMMDNLNISF
jgi:hypothetical protein